MVANSTPPHSDEPEPLTPRDLQEMLKSILGKKEPDPGWGGEEFNRCASFIHDVATHFPGQKSPPEELPIFRERVREASSRMGEWDEMAREILIDSWPSWLNIGNLRPEPVAIKTEDIANFCYAILVLANESRNTPDLMPIHSANALTPLIVGHKENIKAKDLFGYVNRFAQDVEHAIIRSFSPLQKAAYDGALLAAEELKLSFQSRLKKGIQAPTMAEFYVRDKEKRTVLYCNLRVGYPPDDLRTHLKDFAEMLSTVSGEPFEVLTPTGTIKVDGSHFTFERNQP